MTDSLCQLQLLGMQHESKFCSSSELDCHETECRLKQTSAFATVMCNMTMHTSQTSAPHSCNAELAPEAKLLSRTTAQADLLLLFVEVSSDCREHMLKVDPAVHAQL